MPLLGGIGFGSGATTGSGVLPPAVVSAHTASSTIPVTIGADSYTVYRFTGTGSITIGTGGIVDVLVQGAGGPGNTVDASGGAGGGGGQVEKVSLYVAAGNWPIRIGTGIEAGLSMSNPLGTSEFYGIAGVGGAPSAEYRDRMCGGGACGSSYSYQSIGAPSYGLNYQGRIGATMRGGHANGNNTNGGGIAGDNGAGYNPGADWGSPGILGGGGNAGNAMSANTGNGGNNGAQGNSGLVLIRIKN